MIRKESYINKAEILIALLLACFYLVIGMWVQSGGWFSSQCLFFSEKAQMWTSAENNTININLFTYPLTGFWMSLPFSLINSLSGPIIASSIGMSLVAYYILSFLRKENSSLLIRTFTFAIFVLHPTCIYIAISGSSAYLTILVSLLYYICIINYITKSTTYYLALASILLSVMIFVDYKMIWLGLFILPVFAISCFNNFTLMNNDKLKQQLKSIFLNKDLALEYFLQLLSRLFLFYLLPISSFIVYMLINDLYTANPFYFIESIYANLLAKELLIENNPLLSSVDISAKTLWTIIAKLALSTIPLVCVTMYAIGRNFSQITIMWSAILIIVLQKIIYPHIPQSELFLICVFVCIITNQHSKNNNPKKYLESGFTISILFMLSLSWYNLYDIKSLAENKIITTFFDNKTASSFDAEKEIANFITNQVKDNERILTNNAISYPIIALSKNISKFILPNNAYYNKAIQDPVNSVDYVLISQDNDNINIFDDLSIQINRQLQTEEYEYLPVCKASNWALYKTNKRQ